LRVRTKSYGTEGLLIKTAHYVIGSLVAAGLFFIAPACASTYGSRSDLGRDYRGDSQRRAFASGQSEGLKNGRSDAEKGHRFEYEQHDAYCDADKGYNRRDDRRSRRQERRPGLPGGRGQATFMREYREPDETAKGPVGNPPASSAAYGGVNDQEGIRNIGSRSEHRRDGCRRPSFSAGRSNDPETSEFLRPNNSEAGGSA
jgi:hypothetical protein